MYIFIHMYIPNHVGIPNSTNESNTYFAKSSVGLLCGSEVEVPPKLEILRLRDSYRLEKK